MAATSKTNSSNKGVNNGELDPLWQNIDWCVEFPY
jgi:hypothetical protein